ncbi:MAG: hypothetical protein KGI33_10935 [Thaumarchaeota archaeon]|nr:hypothetical protein [Nitrososphaerota archaeon]
MKRAFGFLLVVIILIQVVSIPQAYSASPCADPYCPNTPSGYQHEGFRLKYTPTVCEIEPSDPRFPNLAEMLITTTHLGIENWLVQLDNGSGKEYPWKINEVIMPPTNHINLDPSCNIAIVYESQELDYCGDVFNGVYFPCGPIFNGITIPNNQTNTALILIPYLMPVYGKQCEYEKNGVMYDMICRLQNTLESQPRVLKAIQHEMGHSMGLGHFIANSQAQAESWIAGTEPVPSIMVSGEEGILEYTNVTKMDAGEIRSIYGSSGFDKMNSTTFEKIQSQDGLRLVTGGAPVPAWMKNTALWWSEGRVSDAEFKACIQYLAEHGIIKIRLTSSTKSTDHDIPGWIKEMVGWWATNKAGKSYFLSAVQWILENDPSILPVAQTGPSISLATDKSSYSMGDLVVISGTANPTQDGTVTILILDPNNLLFQADRVIVSPHGSFHTQVFTTPSIWKMVGRYVVEAEGDSSDAKAQTTFYFRG